MISIPYVIEITSSGERGFDIFSRLLRDRIIMLTGEINDALASMGAFLLAAGAAGKRYALPNSEVMIHQPSGAASGQATDIKLHAERIIKTRSRLNRILSEITGKTLDRIERDTERDNFMSAEEAREYGLVDRVLVKRGSLNEV